MSHRSAGRSVALQTPLLLTLLATGGCSPAPAARATEQPRAEAGATRTPMVLLLSIDGLMPGQILGADALGLRVPNLRRLVREGSFATGVRGVVPGLTYPAHTTMLTGTSPDRHGILANLPFDPLGQNQNGWSWYAKDIRVPTLWSAAKVAKLATASVYWPVSVSAPVEFNLVQYWRGSPEEDHKLCDALSTPGLVERAETALGIRLPYGQDFGAEADETRGRFVEYLLRHQRPTLTTAYLASLDEAEHRAGTSTQRALAVLERLDRVVGRLRAALEAVARDRFVLVVVSDHGFADYSRELELGALLVERGLLQLGREQKVVAWKAGAWLAGGTAGIVVQQPAARPAVEALLRELEQHPQYGVSHVFRGAELDPLGGFSSLDYVIALREGFRFGAKLTGPIVRDATGATHGYLPDEPGMDAAFLAVGEGVPVAHSLGRIDLRDVAPTVAAILGVTLPTAEGRILWPVPPRD